jgi:hypothetical protein
MAKAGIPQDRYAKIPLAHKSDLIRTWLLIQHGGIWADPTVYFNYDIDEWLQALLEPSGLFLFHRPGRDREISNWFIAAEAGHPILERVFQRLCEFWTETDFRNVDRADNAVERTVFKIVNRNLWAPRIWTWSLVNRMTRLFPYMIYHYVFYDVIRRNRDFRRLWEATPKISADGPHLLGRFDLSMRVTRDIRDLIEKPVAPVYKLSWKALVGSVPDYSLLALLSKRAVVDAP